MSSQRSRLFLPALAIVLAGSFAIYRMTPAWSRPSHDLIDSARASTPSDGASRVAGMAQAATLPAPTLDTAAQAPRLAPDFELKDLEGKVHHLSDYRGKVVVLNFWATWCPPCRKELPDFVEIQKAMADQGVQFIGIALDDEGIDKVKPWVASHAIPYPILLPDTKVAAQYGEMSSIPVTYFIDRKGMIRQTFIGMRQRPIIEKAIAPLVAEK